MFGQVVEGLDVLEQINQVHTNEDNRPLQNIRIKHTLIIDDPFEDKEKDFGIEQQVHYPSRSPSPEREKIDLKNIDLKEQAFLEDDVQLESMAEKKTEEELKADKANAEAKSRALGLEILDDLPEADIKPPENVLFVCKLNPVTQSDDLEIIFSRFGKVVSCEVIRDWKTQDSLQYAFVEFEEEQQCINAYSKMDNVLIDERRVKVDFSNSVAKLWNKHNRKNLQNKAYDIIQDE